MGLALDRTEIVAPDGSVALKPTIYLTPDEAKVIRAYERLMKTKGLRRPNGIGVYCDACFEANRQDGTRYFVEPHQILIECRCTVRRFTGATL